MNKMKSKSISTDKLKFAIAHSSNIGKSMGGPPGYLYNLYDGFNQNEKPDFLYIEQEDITEGNKEKKSNVKTKKRLDFLRKNYTIRQILYFFKQGLKFRNKYIRIVNDYKLIHVHTSEMVIYVKKFCRFKGILVFTPHRPEPLGKEVIGSNLKKKILRCFFDSIEKKSYKLCDAMIFPSKGAEKIYYDFPGYEKYAKNKIHRYLYTGIRKRDVTISVSDYRKKYGISNDKFLIGYVGRHIEIKGYDRLVSIAEELQSNNVEVVVAGASSEIIPPKSTAWHELGYINDSQNLINAVDLVVIPNRNTYFDLVILEALSQGKRVVSSNTGGNIDIARDTEALILFDNDKEHYLLNTIIKEKNRNVDSRKKMEDAAISFYEMYSTNETFANNYLKRIEEIYMNIIQEQD